MDTTDASFRKSVIAFTTLGVSTLITTCAATYLIRDLASVQLATVVGGFGALAGLAMLLVAVGGVVAIRRQTQLAHGGDDLFIAANRSRSESAMRRVNCQNVQIPVAPIRRLLNDSDFVVGDIVRIRSLSEIAATLDADGRLNGMPFMPEMMRFCGGSGVVFRVVDKIYDYGGKKDLRRLQKTVLLTGLRCDGSAHGGCQAGCYLLWKTDWLERDEGLSNARVDVHGGRDSEAPTGRDNSHECHVDVNKDADTRHFRCQFTDLVTSSTPMKSWDPRQDLRPLIAGNVTLRAFAVALTTRLFNAVQRARGGAGFPRTPSAAGALPHVSVSLDLQVGDLVRVLSSERIHDTLDRAGKHRGLWFDRDMLKHCGHSYRVRRRVEKIIDDSNGRMLQMKTPCIVLDAVYSTGEFLRFCAQHDYAFWREAWLERVAEGPAAANQN